MIWCPAVSESVYCWKNSPDISNRKDGLSSGYPGDCRNRISFSSDGIDAGLRARRLQLLQSSSFSLEKREKSKSSRTTEEMFNSPQKNFGKTDGTVAPTVVKGDVKIFQFFA